LSGASVDIEEGTVRWVAGVRVGAGSIWTRDYPDPAGVRHEGPSALLAIADAPRFVAAGARVEIGGGTWLVEAVEPAPEGRRGRVRLRPVDGA
jgi:hypothetical protein